MFPAHRHSDTVTHYIALLIDAWDHLSDRHQLDTDRAKQIIALQNQLERLDVRLIADPTDKAVAARLEHLFAAIDSAIDTVRDTPEGADQQRLATAWTPDCAPS